MPIITVEELFLRHWILKQDPRKHLSRYMTCRKPLFVSGAHPSERQTRVYGQQCGHSGAQDIRAFDKNRWSHKQQPPQTFGCLGPHGGHPVRLGRRLRNQSHPVGSNIIATQDVGPIGPAADDQAIGITKDEAAVSPDPSVDDRAWQIPRKAAFPQAPPVSPISKRGHDVCLETVAPVYKYARTPEGTVFARRKKGMGLVAVNHVVGFSNTRFSDGSRERTGKLEKIVQVRMRDATGHAVGPDGINVMAPGAQSQNRLILGTCGTGVWISGDVRDKKNSH
ncbi:hypothetical protein SAMN05421783_101201 [Thiocapsa roseopersicina]|uniref:Uncharacterized protein n=1 Tax=Thiocapsa roseopersicina TaxID=1058 RepID=A0A1H2QDC4_THIRO|nr:hypothetical protein SAMN05421783_101201 [Thiocapsa roseopersicina]